MPASVLWALLAASMMTNVVLLVRFRYAAQVAALVERVRSPVTVAPQDHVLGRADAAHTVVIYTDFECPFCRRMHQLLRAVQPTADVRWVYRHFPLPSHAAAPAAAEAAECAAEQGRFWEYADALFARQDSLGDSTVFAGIASELHLDASRFAACRGSGRVAAVVAAQRDEGGSRGLTGTPTLYVDGWRMDGVPTAAQLRERLGLR